MRPALAAGFAGVWAIADAPGRAALAATAANPDSTPRRETQHTQDAFCLKRRTAFLAWLPAIFCASLVAVANAVTPVRAGQCPSHEALLRKQGT